ncbi:hypothetical protein [Actinomadura harenae]|uniref:Uncharacterized protein n=1 Tax=Actinomadura harenae TaxID=2483351 RepID=A0A3M2M7H5_9ACTN|nr:hypothetical protein [Actinomadura harenae]RMI44485.1 hypothetical protein EBO15_12625 [Actinomadura harenae]
MTVPEMDRTHLLRAAEIVRAAYEEAMRRHGFLSSTIRVVSMYAEQSLAELDAASEDERDLDALGRALGDVAGGLDVLIKRAPDGDVRLHVNNPQVGGRFCEDVSVGYRDGVRVFLWSWGEAIASIGELGEAARRLACALDG